MAASIDTAVFEVWEGIRAITKFVIDDLKRFLIILHKLRVSISYIESELLYCEDADTTENFMALQLDKLNKNDLTLCRSSSNCAMWISRIENEMIHQVIEPLMPLPELWSQALTVMGSLLHIEVVDELDDFLSLYRSSKPRPDILSTITSLMSRVSIDMITILDYGCPLIDRTQVAVQCLQCVESCALCMPAVHQEFGVLMTPKQGRGPDYIDEQKTTDTNRQL
eukprot:GHVH01000465.1.p1 GENE.GHVH01000465.1~~GHVH01000465.1.p1  ORF type:complete len:224 (+),score=29.82 GHVH01000465.1:797-1468(+)